MAMQAVKEWVGQGWFYSQARYAGAEGFNEIPQEAGTGGVIREEPDSKDIGRCECEVVIGSSDTFGVSGSKIIEVLLGGELTLEEMSALARGKLRKKKDFIREALVGKVTKHHVFMIKPSLPVGRQG